VFRELRTADVERRERFALWQSLVVLNLAGHQRIDQDRRSAILGPGDLTIYHTSRPMRTYSDPGITRESAVVVAIPGDRLPYAAAMRNAVVVQPAARRPR
jgi:hypothetical protein